MKLLREGNLFVKSKRSMKLWRLWILMSYFSRFPTKPNRTKTISSNPPTYQKTRANLMLLVGQSNLTKYSMEFSERKPQVEAPNCHLRERPTQRHHEKKLTQYTMKGSQMITKQSKPIPTGSISTIPYITTKQANIKESWTFSY